MLCVLTELVRERGMKDLSMQDIVQELMPQARAMIPDDVKVKTLARIHKFVDKES